MGVLNSACLITVTQETGQAAATILYENLAKMFARMLPESRQRAVWVVNNTAIPQLLTLTIPVGTAGSVVPVLSERDGQFTMLTRPVVFTEKLPALGTVGDVILADFSSYAIGLRTQISLMISPHVRFTTDELSFRLRVRMDGQPLLSSPITPVNGDTLSPFVTLETRS